MEIAQLLLVTAATAIAAAALLYTVLAARRTDRRGRRARTVALVVALAGPVMCLGLVALVRSGVLHGRPPGGAWQPPPADLAEVRRVVDRSQLREYDFLKEPATFEPQQLREYWLPADKGGQQAALIEKEVGNLRAKGLHYGPKSRRVQFEVLQVHIDPPGDEARVQTRERWYYEVYREDGTRYEAADQVVGDVEPFQYYRLRKLDDRWLVEWNSMSEYGYAGNTHPPSGPTHVAPK